MKIFIHGIGKFQNENEMSTSQYSEIYMGFRAG